MSSTTMCPLDNGARAGGEAAAGDAAAGGSHRGFTGHLRSSQRTAIGRRMRHFSYSSTQDAMGQDIASRHRIKSPHQDIASRDHVRSHSQEWTLVANAQASPRELHKFNLRQALRDRPSAPRAGRSRTGRPFACRDDARRAVNVLGFAAY